ncbi:MAG TPA: peptidase M1 [Muricauda sp.]|uniref:M1 family metallopeptidase n=1 Tax=Flagellimonas aurea TaxID=2915619 RepID=A0ABS3G3X9_9FLAO|nr:M1 family metallopeptidase [Allomuricauda aurea]MBO0354111.1 M1 family metallopeptidase [Allomuricauda aurea]UBZ14240.1 M1 family metallopeptidase [Allomuricauda aquimarina]HBU77544.1 peptidase M1 [Allomuricauda sp.]|tara:strand:- start:33 stop:1646 length:1614 start_codon:yes stop_codon:yes gene_type:complete
MKKSLILFAFILGVWSINAQELTRQDTLRGSITPEREWWDLNHYDLNVKVEPSKKFISGYNVVKYKVLKEAKVLQIDLQEPMKIESIEQDGKKLKFTSEGNAHFIKLKKKQVPGEFNEVKITYSGQPREAVRAPWDGGFSWKQDKNGNPFVATSCQGLGASVWWPNKDHMYDEVDSMRISVTVPKELMDVSNGQLESVEEIGEFKTYNWVVKNPINNYGVNVNIGNYVHFDEVYEGENGPLKLDYYVLPENLEKAKKQFVQAPMMLQAFEYWFGPYPFYEDGFKLVEVPYLGMEHQSSVTYGNKFENGYLGRDLSGTGWGLQFDFIIIHEAGHEWFANNITYKDIADMWIHEGFTAYSENLYLDYHFGTKASEAYVVGTRSNIQNDSPIIGPYGVNKSGSGDMYYKGANMLHTLRQLVEDDDKWRQILRGLNKDFYHKTVTTKEIEGYLSKHTGKDLSAFFNQYLRTTMIPTLEYKLEGDEIKFRYTDVLQDFDMPVRLFIDGSEKWLFPSAEWKTEKLDGTQVVFDKNFYIETKKI